MSEVLAVRGSDQVMRELAQMKASVIEAQRVLIVGADSLPKLLNELNTGLADLGYVCVPMEPAQGLYKTFADLLACPTLAPLMGDQVSAPLLIETPNDTPAADPLQAVQLLPAIPVQDPERCPEPVASQPVVNLSGLSLDMAKPINWKLGDVFISNPRFTLPHKCRKWILDSLDVSDLENLTGMEVQLRSPNTTTTELMTLKQFMAHYVFHERPAAEQSTAE